jgi:outer membrane protein insertion porin family/translocation and assembly module TamA
MPVSAYRLVLAATLLVLCTGTVRAQTPTVPRGKYDSITVTTLSFPGAVNVSVDDLRRPLFTRASPCRLPFLIPLCKLSGSQIIVDRRRTTSSALADDLDKLRIYYWQRGFREAQIDTVLTPGTRGVAVAFRIVEGEPTRISSLSVTQRTPVLSEKELADLVLLHEGEPLDLIAFDSTLAHIRATIWNKGYGDVRIDTSAPRPDASRLVPVRIDIDPRWITRVGRVEFEGNAYLSDATLRRGVMLQPGTLYTRDAILESQKRLFESPAIARAVVITPPAGDSVKTITVQVTETKLRHIATTVGFNTIEFGQAAVELRHNNLGSGRWFSLHGTVSNLLAEQLNGSAFFQRALPDDITGDPQGFLNPTYQATATLTQPWIAGARTSVSLSAFAGRRALANVVIDEDFGATLGLVHELAPRTPLGINYRMESTRVQGSAVYFCAGYGVCDAATRATLTQRQRLAPIGVSGWVDRADDLENPTRGYTGVVDAEYASSVTGSTFTHSRIAADASVYRALGTRKIVAGEEQTPKIFALHARAGFVKPDGVLHPRSRFYAGGMQSVRGFAENELGPTVLQVRRASLLSVGCTDVSISSGQCDPTAVPGDQLFKRPIGGSSVLEASAEVRIPLLKALGGVLFVDGAYVGTPGISSPARGMGAITPGGGFRYRSPLGVLRMDFGLRPVGARNYPVVVAVDDANGLERIVTLSREKSYSPIDPSPGTLHSIARRIVVHFAMGQAF